MRHLLVCRSPETAGHAALRELPVDVCSADGVHQQLRGGSYLSLIVDQACDPRGETVQSARRERPLLPILVMSEPNDVSLINHCHRLRVECLPKPVAERDLRRFLRRAGCFGRITDDHLKECAQGCARSFGLTAREEHVMLAQLAEVPRSQLLDELGVSPNTLKSQVRSLLRKTGHASLEALARGVLRTALSDGWGRDEVPTSPC